MPYSNWEVAIEKPTSQILLTNNNLGGDLTIEELYLAAYVSHLHIFAHQISPLKNIRTIIDITVLNG